MRRRPEVFSRFEKLLENDLAIMVKGNLGDCRGRRSNGFPGGFDVAERCFAAQG